MNSDTSDSIQQTAVTSKFNFKRFLHFLFSTVRAVLKKTWLNLGILFIIQTVLLTWITCNLGNALSKIVPGLSDDQIIAEASSPILLITLFIIITSVSSLVTIVISYYQASASMQAYNRRESAWAAFLLPVSRSEKFISSYVLFTIVTPILLVTMYCLSIFISTFIAGTLQVGPGEFIKVFSQGESVIPNIVLSAYSDLSEICETSSFFNLSCLFLSWMWLNSTIYFSGATLFKNHPFILSTLGIFIIQNCLIYLVIIPLTDAIAAVTEAETYVLLSQISVCAIYIIAILLFTFIAWRGFLSRTVP